MSDLYWAVEWQADAQGNVLRLDGDKYTATYRWELRERVVTPDEADQSGPRT